MNTQTDYPAHIYDEKRREIAVRYVRHELRKLFPSIRDEATWQTIDADIANWYKDNWLLMPIRDFWNGVHGISMGFKLKNIVSWLTSKNIAWEEKRIRVDDLAFGSAIGNLGQIRPESTTLPSVAEVRAWHFDPSRTQALEEGRALSTKNSEFSMSRDDDPVFAVRKNGALTVIDGNRRLLRAILFEEPDILAVVGEPIANPLVFESWVPTSILIDLASMHRYWTAIGRDTTNALADVITASIRDSSAGRLEFFCRATSSKNPADITLIAAVKMRLADLGVALDADT